MRSNQTTFGVIGNLCMTWYGREWKVKEGYGRTKKEAEVPYR